VFPPGAAEAIVLWCIFAHAHDAARHSPVLALTSPEKRCGKTTALAIIEQLVPKPLQSSNITTAAIYRVIEKYGPTLLIDEADSFLSDNNAMRGVLNSGHRRSSAMIYRCVGDEHEPIGFRTWAPKAIAMIGDLPDTLADRAINIRLRRRLPDETIADLDEPAEAKLQILCRKAARWVADQFDELKKARPSFPDGLQDRANDNWRTMLAIADTAGGAWTERARNAAVTLSQDDDEGPTSVMLLTDIRTVFEAKATDVLPTTAILSGLWKMHDRPWPQWYHGQTITARGLSKLLTPFGIKPQSVRIGDKTPKGYRRKWFEDAWKRYLPPISPE